jgi:hypothetical protein
VISYWHIFSVIPKKPFMSLLGAMVPTFGKSVCSEPHHYLIFVVAGFTLHRSFFSGKLCSRELGDASSFPEHRHENPPQCCLISADPSI